jgi:hypothetical protein
MIKPEASKVRLGMKPVGMVKRQEAGDIGNS